MEKKVVKDETTGEEKEFYKASEVDEALKEKEEKEKSFAEEKEKLESDLKSKEEALSKANEKDKDFKAVREAKELAEKKLKETTDIYEKEKSEIREKQVKEQRDRMFDVLSGNDKEIKKKMDYYAENELKGMPRGTKEEIDKLATAAYKLSTGITDDNKISGIISSAGGGRIETSRVSPELSSIGKKFGLTDKDWENAEKQNLI